MERRLGVVGRYLIFACGLAAVTAAADISFSLTGLALAGPHDGRYAVDIVRTFVAYGLVAAVFAAAAVALHGLLRTAGGLGGAEATPHAAAAMAAVWAFGVLVAVRTVHGAALIGATTPPGALFHACAAVVALAIGYVIDRRLAAWAALAPRRHRLRWLALSACAAAATLGPLALRQRLGLEPLVRRQIAAIAPSSAPVARHEHPDVLLLTIDTLRADRLGSYGYSAAQTPALDGLAAESTLFERAVAQSSWTRPSFGTLFTSRYPSDHGAAWRLLSNEPGARRSLYNKPLRSDLPTLAELLDAAGYLTVAINTNVQTSKPFGFDHGFDHFIDVSRPLSALTSSLPCRFEPLRLESLCAGLSVVSADYPYLTADRVFEIFSRLAPRLEARADPYFLWLHLMDPHVPYRAHDGSGDKIGYDDIERLIAVDGGPTAARRVGRVYDRAVAFTDGYVRRVLERLDDGPRESPPLVVLTSDHGEEMLERWRPAPDRPPGLDAYYRGYGHGHTMYEELVRVPLLVRFPSGTGAGRRVRVPVGHIDVLPTILAAAGVATGNPRYRPEGIDLAALSDGAGDPERILRSEKALYGAEVKQLTGASRKLVMRYADRVVERYDLAADPSESRALEDDGAAAFAPLEEALDTWLAAIAPEPDPGSAEDAETRSIERDDALRRQLEALGYVQ